MLRQVATNDIASAEPNERESNMKKQLADRRRFIKDSVTTAAGLVMISALPNKNLGARAHWRGGPVANNQVTEEGTPRESQIRFSVIGINHDHIHGQVGAVTRGGGQLVSFFA
jgi:hypothetical protein